MITPVLFGLIALVFALGALALIGRANFKNSIGEHQSSIDEIANFHKSLALYANSNGDNQEAFRNLSMSCPRIEAVLGWDNIVSGITIGQYILSGAPILPMAIQQMRVEYNDPTRWRNKGTEIADALQTVLFRHVGRRENWIRIDEKKSKSIFSCIINGWISVSAIPISVMEGIGLLNSQKSRAAKESPIFKIWALLLALATFAGPLMAYLADKDKIDARIEEFSSGISADAGTNARKKNNERSSFFI